MNHLTRRHALFSGTALFSSTSLGAFAATGARAEPANLAAAPILPAIRLTAAVNRPNEDLSGAWAYSKDLYKTGWSTLMDWKPSRGNQRFTDVDVAAEEARDRYALFEYDMQKAPRMALPGAWNAALPQLRYYDGLIWFQRTFIASPKPGYRALLRFEAVNYVTQVFVNGKPAGAHEGGFTPFTFDITDLIRDGVNQVTLGVDSSHTDQSVPPRITDWDIYGGVTRPVRLFVVPDTFIDDLYIRYTPEGRIIAEARLLGPAAANSELTLSIPALKLSARARTDEKGEARFDIKAPRGLKLWTPETPTLYDVTLTAGSDTLSDRVGFRTVAVKGHEIRLNGKPIFLRGICLHEEEFGSNPARIMTEQASRALLTEVKHGLNGNFVRLSHYPHSEVTTRLADEMGLLVWSEIPVYWAVAFADERALTTARRMMAENILRDRNRASLIIWSVGNETPKTEARNRFMGTLADDAKRLDPSRLTSAALLVNKTKVDGVLHARIDDPLVDKLDIMSANTYTAWYGGDKLEDVPPIRWSAPVDKPLIFSEFGADALAGFHARDRRKFSEEFQADFYRATLANAATVPFLAGLSPWILKDFQTPRREHPVYQNGWNRKGLLSETGARKQAFAVLADWYRQKAG
ncbi:glycoside hydrolase family 2 protein [Asticcacaulis sp. AND118]|uniref:glycoside hydrolase family 2 protein n=1 Tax=Asticcacaulis sp. AND118 TaxID=2840468 RepID=UPI001CFF7F29|nr:glycoside hydrolase family 2 TIM barrel-domain containing protein [Asticcacaulis sp. AND118]UDF05694.1 beta-glucuronidase [Asticcacaulis sp. AND118]